MNRTINQLPVEIQKFLKKVEPLEIFGERVSGKKGVVLKVGNEYYMYVFPSKLKEQGKVKFVFGEHLCGKCNLAKNGKLCPKVSDLSVDTCKRYSIDYINAYAESKRIEKYDFIIKGVECFNSIKEYFIVSECTRYTSDTTRKNKNI